MPLKDVFAEAQPTWQQGIKDAMQLRLLLVEKAPLDA
jgi:hypothetical protein